MNSIVLYLMSLKGLSVFEKIISNGQTNRITAVVSSRDKGVENDYYEDIEKLCLENSISFYDRKENASFESNYYIAISWRWLIKIPTHGKLIVLHDSILPKYRGFAPLVNQLINGEAFIGVTALFASEEYDKGPIIAQEKTAINYPIKINTAIHKIIPLYQQLVAYIITKLDRKEPLLGEQQSEEEASYSLWRNEEDYRIDWGKDATYIRRFVDALGFPYKGAKTCMGAQLITIEEVSIWEDVKIENRDIGKVIFFDTGKPVIVCGKGLLKIEKAVYGETSKSIFPMKKFRVKFK